MSAFFSRFVVLGRDKTSLHVLLKKMKEVDKRKSFVFANKNLPTNPPVHWLTSPSNHSTICSVTHSSTHAPIAQPFRGRSIHLFIHLTVKPPIKTSNNLSIYPLVSPPNDPPLHFSSICHQPTNTYWLSHPKPHPPIHLPIEPSYSPSHALIDPPTHSTTSPLIDPSGQVIQPLTHWATKKHSFIGLIGKQNSLLCLNA